MKTKTEGKSRILEAVHETASDLHSAGFISKHRMREYDALCLALIPRYSRKKIRALRQRHRISQARLSTGAQQLTGGIRLGKPLRPDGF
jgi:putative transcriptional regulator